MPFLPEEMIPLLVMPPVILEPLVSVMPSPAGLVPVPEMMPPMLFVIPPFMVLLDQSRMPPFPPVIEPELVMPLSRVLPPVIRMPALAPDTVPLLLMPPVARLEVEIPMPMPEADGPTPVPVMVPPALLVMLPIVEEPFTIMPLAPEIVPLLVMLPAAVPVVDTEMPSTVPAAMEPLLVIETLQPLPSVMAPVVLLMGDMGQVAAMTGAAVNSAIANATAEAITVRVKTGLPPARPLIFLV